MENHARIKVNLTQREFELAGSEEFVEKYTNLLQSYFRTSEKREPLPLNPAQHDNTYNEVEVDDTKNIFNCESFGELYSKVPPATKDVDKILIAGYFCQNKNGRNNFSSPEASKLLIEQNVKLTNPGASLKANLSLKKVFKDQGNYRVSETGIIYLKSLFGIN